MYNVLSGLKGYFKRREIAIDNPIFRLHCSFSAVFLFVSSMALTGGQLFSHPIICHTTWKSDNLANAIGTYCWISGTFIETDSFFRPESPHNSQGIGNCAGGHCKRIAYYQWVCFVLFFQGLMCYFPKYLWGRWEGRLMKTVVCGLNIGLRTEESKREGKSRVINYLMRHLGQHNLYAFHYWLCELMCAVNVVLQMFLMDWFLQGDFFNYGRDLIVADGRSEEDRIDHMKLVFPVKTKCTFRKFGPSGSIERDDALCILPQNIINEKTYVFLWFWFIFLGILSALTLVFRVLVILWPGIRTRLLLSRNKGLTVDVVEGVTRNVGVSDWWLLYMMGRNVDPLIYKDIVVEFAKTREVGQQELAESSIEKY